MTKKEVIRMLAFLLVVCVMILALCELFEQENSETHDRRYCTYRNLEKNTVDAVYVGTSGVDRYWISAKAYEEYGMTVYPVSFNAMAGWLIPHMMDDLLEYQDPELILIDVRPFTQQNTETETMDVRGRRVIDSMDFFSPNRLRAALKIMEVIHTADEEQSRWDLSYIFPMIKYHSKWSMDYRFEDNMPGREHKYLGFYMSAKRSVRIIEQEVQPYRKDVIGELDPLSEEALYDLLAYIREKNLNVLFVDTPKFFVEQELPRTNRIYQILEQEGFDYLSFYTDGEDGPFTIDLDPKMDFYNSGHVNYYGAEKFTSVLAAYLDERFDFPDHRSDENVKKDWDGVYEHIKETIKGYEESYNSTDNQLNAE